MQVAVIAPGPGLPGPVLDAAREYAEAFRDAHLVDDFAERNARIRAAYDARDRFQSMVREHMVGRDFLGVGR
jgi:hypothetical protein